MIRMLLSATARALSLAPFPANANCLQGYVGGFWKLSTMLVLATASAGCSAHAQGNVPDLFTLLAYVPPQGSSAPKAPDSALQKRAEAIAAGQAEGGCIGKNKFVCAATLATKMEVLVGPTGLPDSIFAPEQKDVNGNVIRRRDQTLEVYIPGTGIFADLTRTLGPQDVMHVTIGTDADNATVRYVYFHLPTDPNIAKTSNDYAKTGLFQIMSTIGYENCRSVAPAEVYQTFENVVKPTIGMYARTYTMEGNYGGEQSKKVTICGLRVKFDNMMGESSMFVSLDNPTGVYGGPSLMFEAAD
jgi:hypothetical protein